MSMGNLGTAKLVRLLAVLALLVLSAVEVLALEGLDLEKAVKIGDGKIRVIEFTDPDCSFCRKAEAYFQKRSDVTRYVFFKPLKMHPAAKAKVQYVLSSRDKAKAFKEVSSDSFDQKKLEQITPAGIKLQEEHEEMARANKITATPTFMVKGSVIEGLDLKKLEPLLKPAGESRD